MHIKLTAENKLNNYQGKAGCFMENIHIKESSTSWQ